MKNIVFLALLSTIFLASCGLEKSETTQVEDSTTQISSEVAQKPAETSETIIEETETEIAKVFVTNDILDKDILVNSEGMTLYVFKKDEEGISNCSGECLDKWPVFYDKEFTFDGFLSFERADGTMQTSYNGHPLYTFFKDVEVGDIKGHEVKDVWYVVDRDVSFLSMEKVENTLMTKQDHEAKVESGE